MSSDGPANLAAERRARIAYIVAEKRFVRVQELCRDTGASAATIRRDLAELESAGALRRVHGGAVSVATRLSEPLFDDKTGQAAAEKRAIAEAALKFVESNDSIFLDGGSTILALAALLNDRSEVTVVTNSLRVGSTLSAGGPRILFVGGELRRRSQTFVGAMTRPTLEQLHVDKAFMGTIGLSADEGLTTTEPREAFTKELAMSRAQQVIVLADSSKINTVSFVRFGELKSIDVLITDKGIAAKDMRRFERSGIEVVAV